MDARAALIFAREAPAPAVVARWDAKHGDRWRAGHRFPGGGWGPLPPPPGPRWVGRGLFRVPATSAELEAEVARVAARIDLEPDGPMVTGTVVNAHVHRAPGGALAAEHASHRITGIAMEAGGLQVTLEVLDGPFGRTLASYLEDGYTLFPAPGAALLPGGRARFDVEVCPLGANAPAPTIDQLRARFLRGAAAVPGREWTSAQIARVLRGSPPEAMAVMMAMDPDAWQLHLDVYHQCQDAAVRRLPFGQGFPRLPLKCVCGAVVSDQQELNYEFVLSPRLPSE